MDTADKDISQWEAFRNGDKESFASLFRDHYPLIYRYGSKFTQDTDLLKDCIQELFLELWQSHSKTTVLSVKAYLLKSIKYKLIKVLRKNERSVSFPGEGDLTIPGGFEWSHENFLISKHEDESNRKRVLAALACLSNRQKEIIYLKFYQNLSYEEVSEIMNINYQAARNLLCQAIKTLKNKLLPSRDLLIAFP